MKARTIIERRLHKKSSNSTSLVYDMMESLLGEYNDSEKEKFLSPQQRTDGLYVTSETTLDKNIDPRIFRETQLKRTCRWLATNPPVLKIFFSWLFIKKMKMKLDYFSEGEHDSPNNIYKSGDNHLIEDNVLNDFKIHNLGHATQLIQTEGINILTDPVFGDLAPVVYPSMTKQFGRDIKPSELPKIDLILISHNHRDHVDEASLKSLIKSGQQPTLFVPKGDKSYFEKIGFRTVYEFKWHEEASICSALTGKKVTVCSVSADHRSGRYGYDAHKSLVSGWTISPKSRDEILYFAGDTARLDDTRILSLALDIYALYQHKINLTQQGALPKIISMAPGGPNYTRKDMEPTHQSAVDGVIVAFRLALALEEISKKDGHKVTAENWLNATATVFMHHNRFELGPDRFNENIFIYNRMLSYLEMDNEVLDEHLRKQQTKSTAWSLFHRRKDFIIHGVNELKALAEKIWPKVSSVEIKNQLIQFIKPRTHFPLINEKITSSHAFMFNKGDVSSIKPESEKGEKQSSQLLTRA